MFLTIDPGEHPGWCQLLDNLTIVACGINAPPKVKYRIVLVERPTVYPVGKGKRVDPDNIITLAITLGRAVGRLEELGLVDQLEEVEPRTWKGQIRKDVHHRVIRSTLPKHELATVDQCLQYTPAKFREDAMDAVGLAMYGREKGVFT